MKILFDHCFPKGFARLLPGHEVRTTWKMKWDRLVNGKLLATAAAAQFDAMLTLDKNIQHQQNLADLPVKVILLDVPQSKLPFLAPLAPIVLQQLPLLKIGQMIVISSDSSIVSLNTGRDQ